jgi:GntR family transcriptional regulator, transcriptional repressor for pyruvate dehydrogenase complex
MGDGVAVIRTSRRLGDELYDALVGLIDRGELTDGSRLPPENEIAQTFGVSRPIVRETLSRLRDDGLIISRRGSGSYVKKTPANLALAARIEFGPISSLDQIAKCYAFRIAIEGEAACHAAANRTTEDLAVIRDNLMRLGSAIETDQVGADVDYNFHMAVTRASANEWFVSAMLVMRQQIQFTIDLARTLSMLRSAEHIQGVQTEHVMIYNAIEAGEQEAAKAAMRQHLSNACDRIFRGPG